MRVFLESLEAFYFLLSLAALSLSFQPIFTQNPLSMNLNQSNFQRLIKALALPVLLLCELIKIAKY